MKKRTKIAIASVFASLTLVGAACFIYLQFFFTIDIFSEGPATEVNIDGWTLLEKGMSKEQVIDLLGASHNRASFGEIDRWEYNWTGGLEGVIDPRAWLFGQTHPKAYVVFFDAEGRLLDWREPLEVQEDPEQGEGGNGEHHGAR